VPAGLHVLAEPVGGVGVQGGQVDAVDHRVVLQRLAQQLLGRERGEAQGPAAGAGRGQGLLHVERVVEITDFVTLGADHGHGDALIDLHGEEPAVVELRAVLADQADLATVQAAPLEAEDEGVGRAPLRAHAQHRALGLAGLVDVQLRQALLGHGGGVEDLGGGPDGQPGHGHGRLDADPLHGSVDLRVAVAVHHDDRDLAGLAVVKRRG